MSMSLEFEPHSWYMGFAIRDDRAMANNGAGWQAYTDNGMTGFIDSLAAISLTDMHKKIREYHLAKHTGYGECIAARRLKYLRAELHGERMSYGEITELEDLQSYIESSDTELLEAAGVPENRLEAKS